MIEGRVECSVCKGLEGMLLLRQCRHSCWGMSSEEVVVGRGYFRVKVEGIMAVFAYVASIHDPLIKLVELGT